MVNNQFFGRLYAHGIRFIIKGDILRCRIEFLYTETPFIVTVYFISTQNTWHWLDFDSNYFRSHFYFNWSILLSEKTYMNWVLSARVTKLLKISVFTWKNQVLAAKSSKECTLNQFSQDLSFLAQFTISQDFISYDGTYCLNWVK